MLAVADLVDLLAHELAGLRGGRLARSFGLLRLLDCLLIRHDRSPLARQSVKARAAPRVRRNLALYQRPYGEVDPWQGVAERSAGNGMGRRRPEADGIPQGLSNSACRRAAGRRNG